MLIRQPTASLIELDGADALAFAQAQFASDVSALPAGEWQWSCWLSAQGRVRAFFALLRLSETRFWLWLRGGDATATRDALARYVLRAKCQLRVVGDVTELAAATQEDWPPGVPLPSAQRVAIAGAHIGIALPGPAGLRLFMPAADAPVSDDALQARDAVALAEIDAGLPLIAPGLEEQFLPAWLGFTELGATQVGKGCYPGQEIVARLHFKGGNKRWLHRAELRIAAGRAPPAAGDWLPAEVEHAARIVRIAPDSAGGARALVVAGDGTPAGGFGDATRGIEVSDMKRVYG